MITLIDLSYRPGSLSCYEFVLPISSILAHLDICHTVVHWSDIQGLTGSTGCILCGTALADNEFTSDLSKFSWIHASGIPILGICAGMQVLALIMGGTRKEDPVFGMQEITSLVTESDELMGKHQQFTGYELHRYTPDIPDSFIPLAISGKRIVAMKHRTNPWYGVMFHPEVRNEWVLHQFIRIASERQKESIRV